MMGTRILMARMEVVSTQGPGAVTWSCLAIKLFWKISQNSVRRISQNFAKNTCSGAPG